MIGELSAKLSKYCYTPDNLEAATLNVDSAFHCCPILPCQQHNFIVGWNNLFYINHVTPFGAASSGVVFGQIVDTKSAICTALGFGPNLHRVDDFLFFQLSSPSSIVTPGDEFHFYSLEDLYTLAKCLGWPWKVSKTHLFNTSFQYLGFIWDILHKTVSIPSEKKARYLAKLSTWVLGNKFTHKEAESILGTLVHCSLVLPNGRSRLLAILHFAASFNLLHPHLPRKHQTPVLLTTYYGGTTNFLRIFVVHYYHSHLPLKTSVFG